MDWVPEIVDRPHGQSDSILTVTWKESVGRWELQASLDMVIDHLVPPPAIVATHDPSKRRDRGIKRNYSRHDPRLFDAY